MVAKSLGGNGIVDWRKKYTVMQSAGFRMESVRQWTDWSTSLYGWPCSIPQPATPLFLKWKGPLSPPAVCSLAIRTGGQWLQSMLNLWENLKASPVFGKFKETFSILYEATFFFQTMLWHLFLTLSWLKYPEIKKNNSVKLNWVPTIWQVLCQALGMHALESGGKVLKKAFKN